jgi:hypothetical protein
VDLEAVARAAETTLSVRVATYGRAGIPAR